MCGFLSRLTISLYAAFMSVWSRLWIHVIAKKNLFFFFYLVSEQRFLWIASITKKNYAGYGQTVYLMQPFNFHRVGPLDQISNLGTCTFFFPRAHFHFEILYGIVGYCFIPSGSISIYNFMKMHYVWSHCVNIYLLCEHCPLDMEMDLTFFIANHFYCQVLI